MNSAPVPQAPAAPTSPATIEAVRLPVKFIAEYWGASPMNTKKKLQRENVQVLRDENGQAYVNTTSGNPIYRKYQAKLAAEA